MKNTIILSGQYGKVLLLNALKDGYGNLIDDSFCDIVDQDKKIYLNSRINQKVYQIFMLQDEIIVPDFDLPCQFSSLQDIANIEIMEPDYFITYSDSEKILSRLDKEYASYIKPTIVDWLAKNAATFYNYRDEEISTKKYFGDLYDGFYQISDKYKEVDHIWEMNAKRFHIFQKAKMTEPDLVPDD